MLTTQLAAANARADMFAKERNDAYREVADLREKVARLETRMEHMQARLEMINANPNSHIEGWALLLLVVGGSFAIGQAVGLSRADVEISGMSATHQAEQQRLMDINRELIVIIKDRLPAITDSTAQAAEKVERAADAAHGAIQAARGAASKAGTAATKATAAAKSASTAVRKVEEALAPPMPAPPAQTLAGWKGYVAAALTGVIVLAGAGVSVLWYGASERRAGRAECQEAHRVAGLEEFKTEAERLTGLSQSLADTADKIAKAEPKVIARDTREIVQHPLPADCVRDPGRVRATNEAIDAANAARQSQRAVPLRPAR
ncbi:hypothetical protein G6F35_011721 [Rhizopus arrhizus]|nr:hypothetical protein G6F35_011721 [Rhizopus arrhizus]